MTASCLRIPLASPEATNRLARRLAPLLGARDVLLLDGQIGAGKTHFARALIQSLQAASGRAEDVPSPTFTLVQTYQAGPLEIWHADLYRLSHPQDVLELGLDEAMQGALCLIEWPDRLGSLRPADALTLSLTGTGEFHRDLEISASAPRWQPVIAALGRSGDD